MRRCEKAYLPTRETRRGLASKHSTGFETPTPERRKVPQKSRVEKWRARQIHEDLKGPRRPIEEPISTFEQPHGHGTPERQSQQNSRGLN